MKEDLCYVAFNPSTEEQVKQPDTVYKLPDGQTIRVSFCSHTYWNFGVLTIFCPASRFSGVDFFSWH